MGVVASAAGRLSWRNVFKPWRLRLVARAMVLAGNWRSSLVGGVADAQAKGVGQRDQGYELAQVGVFQVKAPSFEVLKALLNGPALSIEVAHVGQANVAEEQEGV